jgi:hypothetical protein
MPKGRMTSRSRGQRPPAGRAHREELAPFLRVEREHAVLLLQRDEPGGAVQTVCQYGRLGGAVHT